VSVSLFGLPFLAALAPQFSASKNPDKYILRGVAVLLGVHVPEAKIPGLRAAATEDRKLYKKKIGLVMPAASLVVAFRFVIYSLCEIVLSLQHGTPLTRIS